MKKKFSTRLPQGLALPASLILTASSPAFSQDAQVQDVIVTAPETIESLSKEQAEAFQSKPQAVTVITQRQIEALQITNLAEAQRLEPSLQFRFGNVRNLTFNVRGFGAAASNATDGIWGGVPIYIDGVYQPRPGQAVFDIPDLIGIEVSKGPQSTSGGQDSTGGVVRIQTALPSFVPQVNASVQYGNYRWIQVKASVTGPIAESDWAAFRVAVFGQDRDGYILSYNGGTRYNDWHDKGVRGQVLLQPTQDLRARLVVDYSHVNQACCIGLLNGVAVTRANGMPVGNSFFQRIARTDPNYFPPSFDALGTYKFDGFGYQQTAQESYGASAVIDYNWNGYTLSSISAYRGWDFHPNNGATPFGLWISPNTPAGSQVVSRSVQQEFKIITPPGQPVEGVAGLFYLYEQLYNHGLTTLGPLAGPYYGPPANNAISPLINNVALNFLGRRAYDNPRANTIAPYGQAVWHATPELDVTAGLRYSYVPKESLFRQYMYGGGDLSLLPPGQRARALAARIGQMGADRQYYATTQQGFVSALASASYKFTPDVIGYVTYARGGRAGGPNTTTNLPLAAPTTVRAETLDDYEVGVKSTWFDGRFLANVAAFVMYNQNYITNVTDTSGATVIQYLSNAKRAVSRGVELDLRANPIDNLFLYASMTYNDVYFASFAKAPCPFEIGASSCDLSGQHLSLTPKWAFVVGGEYYQRLDPVEALGPQPLIAYVGADFAYQTAFYSDVPASIYNRIPAYGLLNVHAGVRFEDASWDLSGWVHNALDTRYFTTLSAANTGLITGNVGQPLTFGFTIKTRI